MPEFSNSPELIAKIQQLLAEIEIKNAKIVGGVYSTSGHNNENLVYRAVGVARYRLQEILGSCDDNALVSSYIKCLNTAKAEFEQNNYDPDGVGVGTLVDVELALKRLQKAFTDND